MSVLDRARLPLAAAGVIFAAALAWVAAAGTWEPSGEPAHAQDQRSDGTQRARDAIAACMGNQSSGTVPDQRCLERTWLQAAEQGPAVVSVMLTAFAEQVRSWPQAEIGCHEHAHLAGQVLVAQVAKLPAADQRPAIANLLATVTSPYRACDNGALHGAMDAYAHLDGADLSVVVAHCAGLDGPARDGCAHGLGHTAWQARHDVGQSVAVCMLLPAKPDEDDCAQGISMQMLRPDSDGSRPAALDRDTLIADLPGVCREFSRAGASPSMHVACFSIAGGELSEEPVPSTQRWLQDPEDRELLREAGQAWARALERCDGLGLVGGPQCRSVVVALIPVKLAAWPDRLADLCAQLPGDAAQECARQQPGFRTS